MEVVRLNQNLFNKLRGNEISSNKNGSRPYYYSFKHNNNRVCIPFRTNARTVPNKYKINLGGEQPDKPNSAIDLTKSIVISNHEYLNNRTKAKIPQNVNNYLKQQAPAIEQKYDNMSKDYINAKATLSEIPLVKYSTMQYFHNELDLDSTIEDKRLDYSIKWLLNDDDKYLTLKDNLNSSSLEVLEKYEDLKQFSELCSFKSTIDNSNNINNPLLIIDKMGENITVSIDDIRNDPDTYIKEYLEYDIKANTQHKHVNNDLEL
ncbi:TPA: hypothetical protein ACHHI6_002694 [Staphylococcus aureus]